MADKEVDVGLGKEANKAKEAFSKFLTPFKAVTEYVGNSVDTFSKLSSTGNAFNNDIVGMKVAAANARIGLDELGEIVTKNGQGMAGLGGSVTKGSQVFTEFSKTFFDSGLTENLRQMGYSSKDLNEVLANQIGFQKSTTDTSVQGQIRTSAAAAALAEEMDLIAKLTGKSRKEQEEQMAKSRQDGQIEAKFRLIGLQQGAEAEKTARENFAKQLAQSQAMGTDAVFKEMFATGTVRSREASMQMALLGGAARETANSAKSLAKGNAEASQAAMDSAKVFNMANQKNEALLQITAAGVGEAANIMKKNIETNDAAFHGLAKTQKAAEAMGKTFEDTAAAMKAQREAIKQEQQARHGATAAMIAATARQQDLVAAVANKVVKPLNEGDVAKAALRFSENITQGVNATDSAVKTAIKFQQDLLNQAKSGGAEKAPVGARQTFEAVGTALGVDKAVQGIDKVVGGALDKALSIGIKTAQIGADVINVKKFNDLPSRDAGTLGKTGMPFEPTDLIAKIHKGEMVLTPDQAKKFMEGAKTDGIVSAISDMSKAMPKIEIPKDMSDMVSDMTTSMPKIEIPKEMSDIVSDMTKSMPKLESSKELLNTHDMAKSIPKIEIPKEMSDMISDMTKSMPSIDMSKVPGTIDISDAKKTVSGLLPEVQKTAAPGKPSDFKMPSMDQISFGPDGMPRISARPQAAAMANNVAAERKTQQDRQIQAAQPKSEAAAPAAAQKEATPETAAAGKAATLDDVVKSLNNLNTTMVQVLRTSSETNNLVERQVKVTKAIGGNVYDRMS